MFKFGFTQGDSPEVGTSEVSIETTEPTSNHVDYEFKPVARTLAELIPEPLRISYEFIQIGDHTIPKRDLYDVKYQLMRKSSLTATEEILLTSNEDIRKSTYEGGIKIWECAADLTNYISMNQQGLKVDLSSILEMGCGAALPSCYALQCLLKHEPTAYRRRLVLSDYNTNVLQLVTAPNIFLSWILITNPNVALYGQEIDITSELIAAFEKDLERRNIEVSFVSGEWGPEFVETCGGKGSFDLVLASETVYSPEIVPIFTDSLLACLRTTTTTKTEEESQGTGLVAAKKIYFGVGGGIPEFTYQLDKRHVPWETVAERNEGIGRAIIRI